MNTEELFADWLKSYAGSLPPAEGLLSVQAAVPRFQTHNFFARFKVRTATFDGTGQNPTNVKCVVVEVSTTDQQARVAADACDSIPDL